MYQNLGESQIKEIISASRFSIFFIDEAQRVTLKDVGTVEEVKRRADEYGAEVHELELSSQFRCNGSDGYLAWLDHSLQIRTTANTDLDDIDYEFKVFDDPSELRKAILEKNRKANKSRMVAGYCWPWASKKDKHAMDIVFPEYDFAAQWNLDDDGMLWAIADRSAEQVGCIHTSQGLEFDYVGVIIGDDFAIRDGRVVTDAAKRAGQDRSVHGYKKMLKEQPEQAHAVADQIVKNPYRTLMTRGQKGGYVYATDPETREYFTAFARLQSVTEHNDLAEETETLDGLHLPIVTRDEAAPFERHVPVYDLSIAAGEFSEMQIADAEHWVELPDFMRASPDLFVSRVVGESMNRRIPNGAWCLFHANPAARGRARSSWCSIAPSRTPTTAAASR